MYLRLESYYCLGQPVDTRKRNSKNYAFWEKFGFYRYVIKADLCSEIFRMQRKFFIKMNLLCTFEAGVHPEFL